MFRSGFVAILGRPNVGKSTLLNRLVGQKIAITSPVAQTTRHRIKGVLTTDRGQIVFLDTPGFSKTMSKDRLGDYLTTEGLAALKEADIFVMVVDGSEPAGKGDMWVAEQIKATGKFVLLIINKVDLLGNKTEQRARHRESYDALFTDYPHQTLNVSARTGRNIQEIEDAILRKLPEGPAYYDEEAVTDQRMREISAEIVREKVLLNTQDEIPHSVAVGIEKFDESDPKITRIYATLYVDQKSQKPIVIGQGGQMIKKIGMEARVEIEELLEGKVYLELNVQIRQNWRRDMQFLKSLGLAPPKDSGTTGKKK